LVLYEYGFLKLQQPQLSLLNTFINTILIFEQSIFSNGTLLNGGTTDSERSTLFLELIRFENDSIQVYIEETHVLACGQIFYQYWKIIAHNFRVMV
jgi:hypothetical protein